MSKFENKKETSQPKDAPRSSRVKVVPESTVSNAQRARLPRRGVATGDVPLATFVRSTATKDDQLSGFVAWCSVRKHERMSITKWGELLAAFHATPAGVQE